MYLFKLHRLLNATDGEPEGGTAPLNPRHAAMAQLAQQRNELIAPDFQSFNEETGEVAPRQDAAPVVAEPHEEAVAETPAEPAKEEPPKPRMVSIVVDGQSIEVEESRIIEAGKRTLQKDHAADRRLQAAAEKERNAQALLEQLTRLSNPDAAPHDTTPSRDASPPQTQATKGVDPEALDTLLEQKLYMRDANKAAEKFKEDFPEIASDPYLMGMAAQMENQRLGTAAALGEAFGDPFKAYRSHGEAVQKWLQERTGKPAAVASPDKQERKRNITVVQAASATAPKPDAKKQPTREEIIEGMRVRRMGGQTQRI